MVSTEKVGAPSLAAMQKSPRVGVVGNVQLLLASYNESSIEPASQTWWWVIFRALESMDHPVMAHRPGLSTD